MNHSIYNLSRWLAWFGGFVLAAIAILSVVSIFGRSLTAFGLGPVPGDFELIEAATALAVFCFMPWAHLRRGHAVVDMFWGSFPVGLQKALDILANALMLLVWVFLVWRMGVAMHDYKLNGEGTFILQMPVWWGYAASLPAAVIGCVIYVWKLLEVMGLVDEPANMGATGASH
jgi:TRAP-type C4-dicarboxylate transport system permease small subunit